MNLASWVAGGSLSRRQPLTTPIELDDAPTRRTSQRVLLGGSIIVATALVWAGVTPIRELAVAAGQLQPSGEIRVIQHLEGGIVDAILARPGTTLKAGDPIVRLAPTAVTADFGQLRARLFDLALQRTRLKALMEGMPFEPPTGEEPAVADAQQSVFLARQVKAAADRRLYTSKLEQQRAEVAALQAELEGLTQLVALQREQLSIREALLPKGNVSKREYLETRTALQQAEIQEASTRGRLAKAREAVAEAEYMLSAVEAEARRIWSEELAKAEAEAAELQKALDKQADRAARLVIRAPADGKVLELVPTSAGDVVAPGEPIGRLVPVGTPLVADVRIKPEDIGHVRLGDRAEVRVTTFDPNIYGRLEGEVVDISSSTLQTPDGSLYYRAQLHLDAQTLGDATHPNPLQPGMVVQANIITGEKSLLRYMLKPVYRTFGLAFSER